MYILARTQLSSLKAHIHTRSSLQTHVHTHTHAHSSPHSRHTYILAPHSRHTYILTHMHTALLTPGYPGSPHFSKTLPLDNEPQDNFVGMDDSLDDMGGGFNSHLSPPQVVPELKPRRGGRVKITEEADPWTLLDPHDPGDKTQNKPFKKGNYLKFP